MGAPVPLKISSALLLLVPSMYSEKNSSVGAARALPSEKASGTIRAIVRKAGRKRLLGAVRLVAIRKTPRVETDWGDGKPRVRYGQDHLRPRYSWSDEALPRHHVRVPDERARLRADQGNARVARPRRGGLRRGGRRHRLQHVHRPREARPALRSAPRAGHRAQESRPRPGHRGRRVLRGGAARADLRALSRRRRRLRPRLDPAPGRLARRRRHGRSARTLRRVEPVRRRPSRAPGAAVPGVGADLDGLQLRLLVLHRPGRPRSGAEPQARRHRRRGLAPGGRRGARGDAPGPERQLLGPRPRAGRQDGVRRAPAGRGRRARHRADPLHEPASEGLPRARHPGHGRLRCGLRAHAPAAPVRLHAGC